MSFGYDTSFNLVEWLAITGLAQSLLILTYIVLRVRDWRQALVPAAYFFFLSVAFGLQFSLRLEDFSSAIRPFLWFARAMGPPLCYLLVLQVAQPSEFWYARRLWVLLVAPFCLSVSLLAAVAGGFCEGPLLGCGRAVDLLYWTGGMAGAICLLAIWGRSSMLTDLGRTRGGKERYWLILMLVATNTLDVGVSLLRSAHQIPGAEADLIRVIAAMVFSYLVTTALFRVYPLPMALNPAPSGLRPSLSPEEEAVAGKVRQLMEVDKLYQEPSFSRTDLAREVGVSESVLSRVINISFGKSFPKLLSEFRIEDAKRLLQDNSIPVQTAAFESGFNSLATFNRVFREVTGETPTAWRSRTKSLSS